MTSLLQKTFVDSDMERLDEAVNAFGKQHNIKASQSYYGDKGWHVRVVFYEA